MARDGSGNFNLAQAAFVAGTTIEAAKVNSDLSDIAAGLTQSMSKDGQTTPTANQPMGGFKFTGLGAGTGNGESTRYEEFKAAFRSMLAGLTLSNNAAPNTKLDVAAGSCADSTNAAILTIVAATIDCATTGALGLDAGSLANSTWYHVYAIGKADGTTSLLASTSVSSPTQPSGYIYKRRLGSFKTDGSAHILPFIQDGDLFQWATFVQDTSAANPGAAAVTRTLASVPTGLNVLAILQVLASNTAAGGQVYSYHSDLATTDSTPSSNFSDSGTGATATGAIIVPAIRLQVRTNTSAQIRSRLSFSDGNVNLVINTLGWVDRRGRDS